MNKVFILIIFLGLLLRLYKLDIPLLEFYPSRQIQTADISRNFLKNDSNILNPTVSYLGPSYTTFKIEFPFYNFIVALFYKVFGVQEVFGRLVSLFCWGFSTIFLYKITQRLMGKGIALLAAFFYTFSPLSVLISRSFQPDQMMLMFSLGALYFGLKINDKNWNYFYLSAIFASLAILIKAPAILFTLPPILFLLISKKKRLFSVGTMSYVTISLFPSMLWYIYAFFTRSSASAVGAFEVANWFSLSLLATKNYYANLFGFEYNLVLLPAGIFLFVLGVLIKPKNRYSVLYVWLGSLILYFLLLNKHNMTHEYYHLPFLPIASIFIGIAIYSIMHAKKTYLLPNGLVTIALLFVLFVSSLVVLMQRAYAPIDRFRYVLETASDIQRFSGLNEPIVASLDAGPALIYYSNRTGWGPGLDEQKTEAVKDFYGARNASAKSLIDSFEEYRKNGAVLFAAGYQPQLISNSELFHYLNSRYRILINTKNYEIYDLRKNI